ncbi:MAG: sigma-70 family RNA polymerase sigma factor [Planctomycetes bacterium]|nr:sigma-70 family RNA polymerase sigma factor [Planctomycetota bacterium]
MGTGDATCWTIIRNATAGDPRARDDFARHYDAVVRAYLHARWNGSPHETDVDDAAQEVFLECFRTGGILERVEADRPGGFRAFLYGAVRNVARRIEAGCAPRDGAREPEAPATDALAADETSLSRVFDRAWALAILREAAALHEQRATSEGEAGVRRLEMLRLRFADDLPIREIAERWGADAARLHHDFARARDEFKAALLDVVAFHRPGNRAEIERECADVLSLIR